MVDVPQATPPPSSRRRLVRRLAGVAAAAVFLVAFGLAAVTWVIASHPYAAGWPVDPTPAQELARQAADGRLAAITFTSAQAARQFVALAEDAGIGPAELRAGGALVAAVGPVTRAALEAGGVAVDVEPERSRMGALYHTVAAALS